MSVASLLSGCIVSIGVQEGVDVAHADESHNRTGLPGLRVVGALRRDDGAHGLHLASIHCSDRIAALVAMSGFEGRANWTVSAPEKQQGRRNWDQPLHRSRGRMHVSEKARQPYIRKMNPLLIVRYGTRAMGLIVR